MNVCKNIGTITVFTPDELPSNMQDRDTKSDLGTEYVPCTVPVV